MRAPQVLITEQQFKDIKMASNEKPERQWGTLKSLLSPTNIGKDSDNNEKDNTDRYFIPTPISTSTDAFRFPVVVTPIPQKPLPSLPTSGNAWNHNQTLE